MEARVWKDGVTTTYRYHPHSGKPINLGTDYDAAVRRVLDMNGQAPGHGTLRWLWAQWQDSKRAKRLSPGTLADYALAWKQIDAHLGSLPAAALTSNLVARYVHITRADSPRRADIEKTLLSNMCRHGILLGVCEVNPTIGVEPHNEAPKRVMPQTLPLAAFLKWLDTQSHQRRVIGMMAEYASLAGNRRCEFLDLSDTQIDDEAGVVRTFRAKQRGRHEVVEAVKITLPLRALIDRARAARGDSCSMYLFPSRGGGPYTERGFKTLWQRCVLDAIKAGVLRPEQRFNFHALRRYYATMHKAETGRLPDMHANPAVTAGVYDGTREVGRKALR